MKLSARAESIKPSTTLAITAKAKQMKAAGRDVVSLSAGEPDFNVPEPAASAAVKAIESGKNKYTPVTGIPELRKAIAQKLAKENGLSYTENEIVVSCGAKQGLFNAFLALLEPCDEVVIPRPYWVSYPEQVEFAGGKCAFVDCTPASGYALDLGAVRAAVTARTKAIILNSPNNPTGAVYDAGSLKAVAALAVEKDLVVISDEIYEKLVYGGAKHVSVASFPGMKERTLVINGFSKAWAMPGWRIGYAAGPKKLIDAIAGIQGHSTSNASSIAQYAALAALGSNGEPVERMRAEFEKRRGFVLEKLGGMRGLSAAKPSGAFYVMIDCRSYLPSKLDGQEIRDCSDFAMSLLEKGGVATVPGDAFGAPGCVRISFATSMQEIGKGLDMIAAFCARLS